MTPVSLRRMAAPLLVSSLLIACGGDSPVLPTSGIIQFTIATAGVDLDVDGYALRVDGVSQSAPTNGIAKWSGGEGVDSFARDELAINCDVTSRATSAEATPGKTRPVDLRVSCGPYLSNVLVFTNDGPQSDVLVMRPDGSRRGHLTTDHAVYATPAVPSDGQWVAVASQQSGGWHGIYPLDRCGKSRTLLVGHSPFEGSPAWSPDGKSIACRSMMSGPSGDYGRIWVINRDGSGLRQLSLETAGYSFDDGPSRSPDGTRVTYEGWVNQQQSILVANLDGTDRHQLLLPGQADLQPHWSPDGRAIVFDRVDNNLWQINRVSVDGTGLTKLSTTTLNELSAVWTKPL